MLPKLLFSVATMLVAASALPEWHATTTSKADYSTSSKAFTTSAKPTTLATKTVTAEPTSTSINNGNQFTNQRTKRRHLCCRLH
jgi:hypothetical protein